MKILVVVASKHGSTREIAEAIAAELRTAAITVDLQAADQVRDLARYDALILGSAIYAGQWLPEIRHLVAQHHADLARLPVWLFSSGPLGAENPQPHDEPHRLAAPLRDVLARDHRVFAGQLDPAALGLGERLIVKVAGTPAGDFRDWAAIRSWARGIARELSADVAAVHSE